MESSHKVITIAIDGPAGAGKSTVAKSLAKALNVFYLDTGAMYRALTLKALREKLDLTNEDELTSLAKRTLIKFESNIKGIRVLLDGEDVSEDIRSLEVTNNTFYIAQAAGVRQVMVDWQRKMSQKQSVVAEGRDIGTVVFPQATYEFYLDADLNERARRRFKELQEKGKEVNEKKLLQEVQQRDQKDLNRKVSPLKKAHDAVFIDSTGLSVQDVVNKILKLIQKNG